MPEANKTVKVDESVHNELNRLKNEHNADTFNSVLRYELGLVPDSVDKLTGYLPEELQETVRRVVDEIESLGDFTRQMTEDPIHGIDSNNSPTIQFNANNRVIAEVTASENGFTVYYLNQERTMSTTGGGTHHTNSGDIAYGHGKGSFYDHWDADDVIESVSRKVSGAYNTWVEVT